jgi:Hint domain
VFASGHPDRCGPWSSRPTGFQMAQHGPGQYQVRHGRRPPPWPVPVRAGAFQDGIPHRDLWLSPDHAVYVGDVLIPIKHLINGTSIRQVPMDDVTYHHVVLDQHDMLLAEGLPCESYLDTCDRSNFDNGGKVTRLFPDFSPPVPSSMRGLAVRVLRLPEVHA